MFSGTLRRAYSPAFLSKAVKNGHTSAGLNQKGVVLQIQIGRMRQLERGVAGAFRNFWRQSVIRPPREREDEIFDRRQHGRGNFYVRFGWRAGKFMAARFAAARRTAADFDRNGIFQCFVPRAAGHFRMSVFINAEAVQTRADARQNLTGENKDKQQCGEPFQHIQLYNTDNQITLSSPLAVSRVRFLRSMLLGAHNRIQIAFPPSPAQN